MKRPLPHRSISLQAAVVVVVFTLLALGLSVFLYRHSMRVIAMTEVENKAIIFLSAMETSVRRLVREREAKTIAQLIEERAALLEQQLNFAIVRVVVRDAEGTIIDHSRPEKIGESYMTEDFEQVMATGRPLVTHRIKTLRLEPGEPEVRVIEAVYPITNRQQGDIQALIKIVISVERSLALIREEYQRYSRRAVIGFVLAAMLLVAGTLFFFRRRIIAPVLLLDQGASRVASGDLETRLVPPSDNEIGNLTRSFNTMVEGLKQREQMRRSLELAREVQQNLLPEGTPDIPGLDIAASTEYCDETGGDYYDFIQLGETGSERVGIVIGDVSGHGVPAALLMATARAFLRQRCALPGSLADIVSDVNIQLTRDVADSGSFMSMFFLAVDTASRSLSWVRAGHDPAMCYDPGDDALEELKGAGIALGVDRDWRYAENLRSDLADGQVVLLGTDGIWETRNPGGAMFGKDALERILRDHGHRDAGSILAEIDRSLTAFRGGVKAEDDVTMIVVKLTADS